MTEIFCFPNGTVVLLTERRCKLYEPHDVKVHLANAKDWEEVDEDD